MMKCFEKGENPITMEQSLQCDPKENLRMYRVSAEFFQNSCSDEIEGVLYFTDITDFYLSNTMLNMLYEKSYEMIAIINMRRKTIASNYAKNFSISQYLRGEETYQEFAEKRV